VKSPLPLLGLASVLGLAACEWDVDTSKKQFSCGKSGECPEGQSCNDRGLCEGLLAGCAGIACSDAGACFMHGGLPFCRCNSGFHPSATDCFPNTSGDPCHGVTTCDEHGSCVANGTDPACDCEPPYVDMGLHCLDPCVDFSCAAKANSHCEVAGETPACVCDDTYTEQGGACVPAGTDLLLHLDETSAPYGDACGGKTVTVHGPGLSSTTSAMTALGNALSFQSGSYLEVADDPAWDFGTGEFTVEAWVYVTSFGAGTPCVIIGQGDPAGDHWALIANYFPGSGFFTFSASDTTLMRVGETATTSVPVGAWAHVAVVRYDAKFTLYINGVERASTPDNAFVMPDVAASLTIGAVPESSGVSGSIDEVRVSSGTARYTGPFETTLPSAAFPCD
jgi:hypothetical protein